MKFAGERMPQRPNKSPESRVGQQEHLARAAIKNLFGDNYTELILNPGDERYLELSDKTREFVKERMVDGMASQLRRIYEYIKRNEAAPSIIELQRLKPILAYTIGRTTRRTKDAVLNLTILTEDLLRALTSENKGNFVSFFEELVAYYKRIYGGD